MSDIKLKPQQEHSEKAWETQFSGMPIWEGLYGILTLSIFFLEKKKDIAQKFSNQGKNNCGHTIKFYYSWPKYKSNIV